MQRKNSYDFSKLPKTLSEPDNQYGGEMQQHSTAIISKTEEVPQLVMSQTETGGADEGIRDSRRSDYPNQSFSSELAVVSSERDSANNDNKGEANIKNTITSATSNQMPDTYASPIASTDYVGLEKIDPRLMDRVWRLNNLYYVINEAGELVKFKLREAQEYLLRNMHHKNILLKARQLGFTTFICIFLLDYALFNRNKLVGILAHTQGDATVIFRKVKTAWENFPAKIKEFLFLNAVGDSKSEYEFTNGSVMRIATSLRSGTYQAVLITEYGKLCAHYPDKALEVKTGTLPAANKGLVFIESTAEGEGGEYYDMVQDARELKRNKVPLTIKDFKFFFFPWYQNPANQVEADGVPIDAATNEYLDKLERDVLRKKLPQSYRNWYYLEWKTQKDKMKQEHPSTPDEAFLMSGNKLFPAEILDAQKKKYCHSPIRVDGNYLIYEEYVRGHVYGLGADVSMGIKRDSSTMCVIDFTAGRVVMTYKSNDIDPVAFAHEVKKGGLMYGGCLVAPEANNMGTTTCAILNQIYHAIYTQVREGLLEEKPTQKLGWLSTPGSKPRMMYELSEALYNDDLQVPDEGVLIEARGFNKEDSLVVKTDENTTRHFDKLIAVAIAWQLRNYAIMSREDPQRVAEVEMRREQHATRTKSTYR